MVLGTSKSASNFDVGAGEFSFCNFDTEVNPHRVFVTLGNCSEATLSWETNKIEKRDATRGTREKLAEVETQRDATLNITMDESDPIKYALAMYGKTAIKTIDEQEVSKVYTVSPGEEIYITVGDTETPAYNYKNLQIRLVDETTSDIKLKVDNGGNTDATGELSQNAIDEGYITVGGTYTGDEDDTLYIKMVEVDTADSSSVGGETATVNRDVTKIKFSWRMGLTGIWSTHVEATGEEQLLNDGVTVKFSAATTTIAGNEFCKGAVFAAVLNAAKSTLIQGKDYTSDEVDVINGKVRFPITSDIDSETQIVVSCKLEKQVFPRVYAGVRKKIEGMIRFEYDPTWGRQKSYLFYHVSISPNGDDSLISEDWSSRQITAAVLACAEHADPENPSSRYYRVDYPAGYEDIVVNR